MASITPIVPSTDTPTSAATKTNANESAMNAEIIVNNAKTGITTTQASNITANNAKLTADETNVVSALDGATLTSATVASDDKVVIQDTSDSDNIKTVTAQSIADLSASGAQYSTFTISGGTSVSTSATLPFANEYNGITGLVNSSGTITLPIGEYLIECNAWVYDDFLQFDYVVNSVITKTTGPVLSDTSDPSSVEGNIRAYLTLGSSQDISFDATTSWVLRTSTSAQPTDGAYLKITKIA